MDVFIGRQPILTVDKQLFGYELLHRTGNLNSFDGLDGNQATAEVISNSYLTFGLDKLSDHKKCFINFTKELILDETPLLFSPDSIIIELLEDIDITGEVIEKCESFKAKGYTIAIDDFTDFGNYESILHVIDIIKVDFLGTSKEKRIEIMNRFRHLPIQFLAEKVETLKEFEEAKALGFKLFQGYFFSKPSILSTKDLKPMPQLYIQMLDEINKPMPDIQAVATLAEKDVALSYKLLRLINSLGLQVKVSNVRQAIVLLGLAEVKKWILILMFTKDSNQSTEILHLSLTRAKLSELVAKKVNVNPHQASLVGMFSLLDTILQRPMEEVLNDLPIDDTLKETLTNDRETVYHHILTMIKALERNDWQTVASFLNEFNLASEDLQSSYIDALKWSDSIIQVAVKV
ncbi:EAL and HDOD domain-containing protein [Alkalihalobacillus sp. CinArs1]|uniref:EAL and HDOD domain-containing protein n=2 Tax=Bacteria TaxID=2 RepID=UPI0022DD5AF8|nr:HDOD domain-containing protein [Alkalihalobacillus sp. CinArs1]